ncbi:hypothetical protein [Priestia sp. TSO9]|uniref:hypothetical protein n=1 Tax=Priestia sp. TSO9 TaxID=2885632 RepID=UPI001E6200CF|nr:hypothetical protein [Priestia sp. TSO9]
MGCNSACCNSSFISPQPIFGSLFGENTTISPVDNTNLEFSTAGPTSGMIANPLTNSITVNTFGVYEINFSLTDRGAVAGVPIQYSIFLNNTTNVIVSTIFFQRGGGGGADSLDPGAKTILIALNTNDVITVRATNVTPGTHSYINPTLVVRKIG